MDILEQVVNCEKTHPASLSFDEESKLNRTFVTDQSCFKCDVVNYCSDFLQNRYKYKQSLLEHLTKNAPMPTLHFCDWCGFVLKSKNDHNYFCKGCGRTVHMEGLDQMCTKSVCEYKVPPTIQEQVKEKMLSKPRIAPHIMIAEGEPRKATRVSSKSGVMQEQYQRIKELLAVTPLTYNEIVEAVPDLKEYKKPLNSLWSIIHKYGKEELEPTGEKPLRLRIKKIPEVS